MRLVASKSATLFWLTAASLTFYAFCDPWNLLVLLTIIGVNFACGTRLAERALQKRPTRLLLAIGIAFNLCMIGYFKYAAFIATNLNAVLGADIPVLDPILPLAISLLHLPGDCLSGGFVAR